jgi:putative polyhydroxyalkanoate system protein
MATIHVHRNHSFGKERAHSAIDGIARQMQSSLGVRSRWEGDTLIFDGAGADGRIAVSDTDVDVEVKLGLFAAPMQGMIKGQIEKYLDQTFGAA